MRFSLMQTPGVPNPQNPREQYTSMGVEERWGDNAFCSCDENGYVEDEEDFGIFPNWFALIDEEARYMFSGETKTENGIVFGLVKVKKNQ